MATKLDIPALQALGRTLAEYSDTKEYFQILVNGKATSFHGVRVFATIGAAKSSLNKELQQVMNQLEYRGQYAKTDQVKEDFALLKDAKLPKWDSEVKEAAKIFRDQLIKEGIIEIVPVS